MINLWLLEVNLVFIAQILVQFIKFITSLNILCVHYILLQYLLNPLLKIYAVKFKEWQKAMQDEFSTVHANDTWSLCPHPANKNVIHSK